MELENQDRRTLIELSSPRQRLKHCLSCSCCSYVSFFLCGSRVAICFPYRWGLIWFLSLPVQTWFFTNCRIVAAWTSKFTSLLAKDVSAPTFVSFWSSFDPYRAYLFPLANFNVCLSQSVLSCQLWCPQCWNKETWRKIACWHVSVTANLSSHFQIEPVNSAKENLSRFLSDAWYYSITSFRQKDTLEMWDAKVCCMSCCAKVVKNFNASYAAQACSHWAAAFTPWTPRENPRRSWNWKCPVYCA